MYLLVAIQSAQSQTKISSLKKLLSELQKIPCGSESLRRLVITKGSFERSRQFLHLCVSSKTTLLQSLSVLLKRKKQTKQKVKLKKHKHAHWVSSIQNKFGVSHPSCKCQTTACLHKEQFPWIERQSSLASVRQWREQQFSWSQIIKVKHFCNNQRNYGLTLFQEWNEALLYQEKRNNFGLHWVTHTM